MKRSLVVTGGIATGKSTFLERFQATWPYGLVLFDADKCVHRHLTTPSVIASLSGTFGDQILTSEGEIDRKSLGSLVFNSKENKKIVESLLHPLVREDCKQQKDDFLKSDLEGLFIADVPLYFESRFPIPFDEVIVIALTERVQFQRLVDRGQLSDADAHSRIDAQEPIASKIERADRLIWNTGTFPSLYNQISLLIKSLQQHS